MPLDRDRIARYARQLLVPGFGEAAQERLLAARVRAVGAGPAASAALVLLVQAGVGRLWIDDEGAVALSETGGWIQGAAAPGTLRAPAAAAALQALSANVTVEVYPAGGKPTAVLVCASPMAYAVAAAEAARRTGVPHVVMEPDGDGGGRVSGPPGAPCFSCSRSTTSAARPPGPGAAAAAALAASELVHMIALPGSIPGRRIDVIRGVAMARPTVRLAGCACHAG
ncbi:MAG TPA: ThiF family adenylyltransferase [Anaeromyxobacteraceae bacterium]|nr:ThiF family adenylyltransferase [Anaeromyxobacteraceae bacterium]